MCEHRSAAALTKVCIFGQCPARVGVVVVVVDVAVAVRFALEPEYFMSPNNTDGYL